MKSIKQFCFFVCLGIILFASQGFSQKCNLINKFTADSLVVSALNDVLVIVKQEYGLKSTKPGNSNLYPLQNGGASDIAYGIGAIDQNKLYIEPGLHKPWLSNKKYSDKKSDTLKPDFGKLYCRKANSKNYEQLAVIRYADSLIIPDTSKFANKNLVALQLEYGSSLKNSPVGFIKNRNSGSVDSLGIIVLMIIPENTDISKAPDLDIKMAVYNAIVHYDSKTHLAYIEKPKVNGKIIGGGFFSVEASEGWISFGLTGLLTFANEKWAVSELPPLMKIKQKNISSSTDPGTNSSKRNPFENKNTNSTEPANNK